MKLTIEIPEQFVQGLKDLGLDDEQAGVLVRDALGEFASTRQPVSEYVNIRYGNHSTDFCDRKKIEVQKRVFYATFIKAGIVKLEDK